MIENYLNQFKGFDVDILILNLGLNFEDQRRNIFSGELSLCYGFDLFLLNDEGCHTIPYLGANSTIWEIRRTTDNRRIFWHEEIGMNRFRIMGMNREFGELNGFHLPYRTPLNDTAQEDLIEKVLIKY